MRRLITVVVVVTSAWFAYASVGNGDIQPANETTVVAITSPTGSGSGTATLQNTTANTTFNVLVGSDATCDPAITFSVPGGNPITSFGPQTSRNVQLTCPPRGSDAMRHCLYHATNNINGVALADFAGLCLYADTPGTLTPLSTNVDFGSVTIGDFTEQSVTIQNASATDTFTRVYLQTTDVDGTFQLGAPCNPDATYCDEELTDDVAPGETVALAIRCRPQSAGMHTAQLVVGTDTFQTLSTAISLQCAGTATAVPALGINPPTVTIPAPVDVTGESASITVRLDNTGGSSLAISDVRIVDVDSGAALDWHYTASGKCSGVISQMCTMGAGDRVAINVTFDPATIGRRRAALLVSYRDTLDRTAEIPLDGIGGGATAGRLGAGLPLSFGQVPLGRTAQLPISLVNDGNRDASVTLALTSSTTPPYTLVPATSTTIAPGTPRTLVLTCAPTAAGMFPTTVTVQGTDTLSMVPLTITADCEGIAGDLYSNPTSLQLEEVRVGDAPIVRSIQLLNASGGPPLALVGQPALEADNPAITLGTLSQSTTPAMFDVTIAPQNAGSLAATILMTTSDGQTLRIPITGTAAKASYLVASELDLGTFCVDQPTTSSAAALVSDGTATITLMAPGLAAPTTAQTLSPFELAFTQPSVYPHELVGGAGVSVAVTPKRRQAATTVKDDLVWHTDLAAMPTATTALTARFIDSGGAIAPPALGFGEVTVHLFTDNGQRVVIQNCNPTPLVLDPPMIRTPFSIDSPGLPPMLAPNESVAFSVGFHPTRVGPVSETLRITSPQLPGTPLAVLLTGTGGSGDPLPADAGTSSPRRQTTQFYACACNSSHPAGGVLIVVAIMCALRPRRRRARIG